MSRPSGETEGMNDVPVGQRAVVQRGYGGPEQLAVVARAPADPGPGEVRLAVQAVGLNFADALVLQGRPWVFRPVFGWGRPRASCVGLDCSGIVEATGPGVDGVSVGDAVIAELSDGALADSVIAPVAALARAPAHLDAVHAAALPVAGVTAMQALDKAKVGEGSRLLVIGGSGSVGSLAIQLAAALGAEVTAYCRPRYAERARSLGAAHVASTPGLPTGGFDAVLDLLGVHPLRERLGALRDGGHYVASFGGGGGSWLGPLPGIVGVAAAGLVGRRHVLHVHAAAPGGEALDRLARLTELHGIVPSVGPTVPLAAAAEAFGLLLAGGAAGKIVVTV